MICPCRFCFTRQTCCRWSDALLKPCFSYFALGNLHYFAFFDGMTAFFLTTVLSELCLHVSNNDVKYFFSFCKNCDSLTDPTLHNPRDKCKCKNLCVFHSGKCWALCRRPCCALAGGWCDCDWVAVAVVLMRIPCLCQLLSAACLYAGVFSTLLRSYFISVIVKKSVISFLFSPPRGFVRLENLMWP